MKTLLKLTAIMLFLAGSLSSCEKDNVSVLKGTKWKLAGIVDETGVLTELEPKDCEKCYMLEFDTDSTFLSNSASNGICGSYKIDYGASNIFIHCDLMTEVAAIGDESLYIETLNKIQSFFLQKKELRLYYNEKKEYLLFKQYKS